MRKILVFVFFIICLGNIISCSEPSGDSSEFLDAHSRFVEDRFTSEGHWYIAFFFDGKFVVLHDPDCDCPSRW